MVDDTIGTVHSFNPELMRPEGGEHLSPNPPLEPEPDHHLPARERLRAFEDSVLGENAVRISGQIERGSGSHFKTKMTEKQRHQHAAFEHLVAAEDKLAHASATHAQAEAAHDAAEAEVARAEEAADGEQSE